MVAGCSYSAASRTAPGTSWAEYMAQDLGWELIHLARQGVSNGGIRIMIDEILRQQPDFAVVTPTFWDRMEIPATASPYDWSLPDPGWDPPLQRHLQKLHRTGNDRAVGIPSAGRQPAVGYDRALGMYNVNYGDRPSTLISETIFSLAENYPHAYRSADISRGTQTAIRYYVDAIYDSAWKKQLDEWIITDGVFRMYHAGRKFLLVPCLLWPWDPNNNRLWRESIPDVIPNHFVMLDERESPLGIGGQFPFEGEDPGYHMSAAGQRHIADCYLARMRRDHGF